MKSIILLLSIMILLAGCGTSKQTNVETDSSVNTGQGKEQSLITAQVTYVGLIDTHSIEVIIDDKPIALQINQEQMKILESLKTNEKLSITYFYNEKTTQNILEKVEIIQ